MKPVYTLSIVHCCLFPPFSLLLLSSFCPDFYNGGRTWGPSNEKMECFIRMPCSLNIVEWLIYCWVLKPVIVQKSCGVSIWFRMGNRAGTENASYAHKPLSCVGGILGWRFWTLRHNISHSTSHGHPVIQLVWMYVIVLTIASLWGVQWTLARWTWFLKPETKGTQFFLVA